MKRPSISGLLLVLLAAHTAFAQEAAPPGPSTAPTSKSVEASAWRTSWVHFVEALDDFRAHAKPDEMPVMGLQGTANGQAVPDTWAIMKRFNGAVVFEGTFNGMSTDGLMDGMPVKLTIRMPTPNEPSEHIVLVHIYPTLASVPTWRALAPGTAVSFRAKVTGVALMPAFVMASIKNLPEGSLGYVVLLQEAEPAT